MNHSLAITVIGTLALIIGTILVYVALFIVARLLIMACVFIKRVIGRISK